MRNKNSYMGNNPTARLPMFGRVDTDNEICLNAIAAAYDALNNIMIARNEGAIDKTNLVAINGRFNVLRMLCKRYAPGKLMIVDKIHKIVVDNYQGRISDADALSRMQNICVQNGMDPGLLNVAMLHVNRVEMLRQQATKNMQVPSEVNMFILFNQQNTPHKKRGR